MAQGFPTIATPGPPARPPSASGRRLTVKTATSLARPGIWQRMRTGPATKGAKDYHWAMIEITPDDTPSSGVFSRRQGLASRVAQMVTFFHKITIGRYIPKPAFLMGFRKPYQPDWRRA